MNFRKFFKALAAITGVFLGGIANAGVILYHQDFENPNPGAFVNDGGDVNIYKPVNDLYGNQPVGFEFAQTYTVETLLVNGTQAWGVVSRTRKIKPENIRLVCCPISKMIY